jgi:ammonia channel protein AmtB
MIIDKTMGLRVSDEDEEKGLDLSIHGEALPTYIADRQSKEDSLFGAEPAPEV